MILIVLIVVTVAFFAYTLGYNIGYDEAKGRR